MTAFENLQFFRCRSSDPELLCDFLPLSREIDYFSLFRTFWRFEVVLNKGERKMSQSAKFELAQEDPIWFLVRRLNHSAMTAWRSFYFILSVIVELLCGFYFLRNLRKYCFLAGSGRFIKYVVWTGNIHSEQDWNLSWRTHRISNQTPSALRHYCISESLVLSVSIIRSWIVVWLSSSFEKLNIFLYFGLSEGLRLCWIKVSEKCRSQQNSNLRRKTPSDF